eukprot:GHVQ01020277.1.p1 GENE.GHVQ01020277.1~~GHVQ01020277.1.p1  ORF type:complete len:823 (+),score=115.54 GHVQ01020277.1:338-2470(+)
MYDGSPLESLYLSPTATKARLLFYQNYKRWVYELIMILFSLAYLLRHWHTFIILTCVTILFECIVLKSRRIRSIRNTAPWRLYAVLICLHISIAICIDGFFFDLSPSSLSSRNIFSPFSFPFFGNYRDKLPRRVRFLGGGDGSSGSGGGISIPAPPPQMHGQGTVDRSAVMVINGETVRTPFSRIVDASMRPVVETTMNGHTYETGEDFTVIIPVRDESDYLSKTIMYTVQNTPRQYLKEFIVVDDASAEPVADVLDRELPRNVRGMVKVLRYETKEGLIRARIAGADLASSANIFFLDGHCRPKPGWVEPLIRHLKTNYKRVACPVILDISAATWEETGTSGFKMMFEWNFEFGWYDDLTDEVPVSAGGILAMTKRWWEESGKYDSGMLEWGGENIEQSIRIWLCGGEIYVVRDSQIGHIFDRPAKPNPENKLVRQVQKNQKRGALVWLDDYYQFFEKHHPIVKTLDAGPGLEERTALRHKLRCMPFQWYVDRFRTAFERKGLLDAEYIFIQHQKSRWCLGATGADPTSVDPLQKNHSHIVLMPCDRHSTNQQWQLVGGQRLIYHRSTGKCIDALAGQKGSTNRDKRPILYECDWNGVFQTVNENQFWQFDTVVSHRIFSYRTEDVATLTGHDIFPPHSANAYEDSSFCFTADLPHWTAWDWSQDDDELMQKQGRKVRDVYYKPCRPHTDALEWTDEQQFFPLWYSLLQ